MNWDPPAMFKCCHNGHGTGPVPFSAVLGTETQGLLPYSHALYKVNYSSNPISAKQGISDDFPSLSTWVS